MTTFHKLLWPLFGLMVYCLLLYLTSCKQPPVQDGVFLFAMWTSSLRVNKELSVGSAGTARKFSPNCSQGTMTCRSSNCFSTVWGRWNPPIWLLFRAAAPWPLSVPTSKTVHVCTSVSGPPFERDSLFDNSYKRPLNLLILVGCLSELQLSYIVVWGKSVATIAPSDSPVMSGLWIFPCTFLK